MMRAVAGRQREEEGLWRRGWARRWCCRHRHHRQARQPASGATAGATAAAAVAAVAVVWKPRATPWRLRAARPRRPHRARRLERGAGLVRRRRWRWRWGRPEPPPLRLRGPQQEEEEGAPSPLVCGGCVGESKAKRAGCVRRERKGGPEALARVRASTPAAATARAPSLLSSSVSALSLSRQSRTGIPGGL
jgi:hypothetical protein